MTATHNRTTCPDCQQRELVNQLIGSELWLRLTGQIDDTFNEVDLVEQEGES